MTTARTKPDFLTNVKLSALAVPTCWPFCIYLWIHGLLGCWATYYCLSPSFPAPEWRELAGASLFSPISLVALAAINRDLANIPNQRTPEGGRETL